MKVTKLTTYRLPPRWMFLKIETDEGITGWGEPVIEGRARSVETAVNELSEYVVGKDPARINDIWQAMYRTGFYRGGPILMSAIAGIDQALWDIKGKVLNAPVYELLGGLVRDRMKMYSWVGGDRPADVIAGIRTLQAHGFDTFKLNGCEEMGLIDSSRAVDAAVGVVAEIRAAFGDAIEFGLDFHGRVAAPMARVLIRELEPYRPLFIEEPVLAEQAEYYPRLAAQTHIPLAAGERMFSRFDFKRVLEGGGIEVDGAGTAIITESCVLNANRNPGLGKAAVEAALKEALGLQKILWLPGIAGQDITDGHTDFYARFVRPGVVVAGLDNDPESFDYPVTRRHLDLLRQSTDSAGRKLDVVVLQAPQNPRNSHRSRDFAAGYINFYVCNGAVIAPDFGDRAADEAAHSTLARLFPGRQLVPVAIDAIAAGGGGIHCATQQEPR